MVFIKRADMKRALSLWQSDSLPREFMIEMLDNFSFAYWISGVLFWCCNGVHSGGVDLNRFLKVQLKIRSVGFCIHEDIPLEWGLVSNQAGSSNYEYKCIVDLRHARFIDAKLTNWTPGEKKKSRIAVKKFEKSEFADDPDGLTRFCRQAKNKKYGYREIQMLLAYRLGMHDIQSMF